MKKNDITIRQRFEVIEQEVKREFDDKNNERDRFNVIMSIIIE